MAINVFDLYATLNLDTQNYDRGMTLARSIADNFESAATDALEAGAKAYTGLVKNSVDEYAEFEQMVGGMRQLFGEDYYQTIVDNSKKAYKTAQMSANEYLNTSTTFAGALLKNLNGDQEEAIRLIDMAMQDAADNVNTFGGDMKFVLRAYQGFGRQTFLMLDNLRLGYGGTKHEARQMLMDAKKLTKEITELSDIDLSNVSDVFDESDFSMLTMDNMIKAIHVMQEYMNITGTAFRESNITIQGSVRSAKAAWKNMLNAFSSGEGMDEAMDNLVDSVFGDGKTTGLINILIPRIEKTMQGISEFLVKATPILSKKIPEMIKRMEPTIDSAVKSLSTLITTILPSMIEELWPAIRTLLSTIVDSITKQMHKEGGIFGIIADVIDFIRKNADSLPGLIAAAWGAITALKIGSDVMHFITLLSSMFNKATLIVGAIGALAAIIILYKGEFKQLFTQIGRFVEQFDLSRRAIELLSKDLDLRSIGSWLGTEFLLGIADGINAGTGMVEDMLEGLLLSIRDILPDWVKGIIPEDVEISLPKIDTTGLEENAEFFRDNFFKTKEAETEYLGILEKYDKNARALREESWWDVGDDRSARERVNDTIGLFTELIGLKTNLFKDDSGTDPIPAIPEETTASYESQANALDNMVASFASLKENAETISLNDVTTNLTEQLETMDFTEQAKPAGESVMTGINTGITDNISLLSESLAQVGTEISMGIQPSIDSAFTWGSDMMLNLISGIQSQMEPLGGVMATVAGIMNSYIGFSEPAIGPLSDFHTYAPDMMNLFAKGIRDNQGMLADTVSNAFDFSSAIGTQRVGATPGYNGWSINVYGAQGMNEETLARMVASQVRDKVVSIGALG